MRYFNIILSASLLLILCVLSTTPALAVADPFEPVRVAMGPDGNIYALISGNDSTVNHIFVFSPDGRLLRAIDGRASEIAFDDSGNLYAGDFMNGYIRKMDINGSITGFWNYQPKTDIAVGSMAVSPDGKLYISEFYIPPQYTTPFEPEFNDSRIFILYENGTQQLVYSENNTNPPTGFHGMTVDANGTIYAVGLPNLIKIISPNGTASTVGMFGLEDGCFSMITNIALGKDGYLYVTEYGNHRVQKLTTDGSFVTKWNGAGLDPFLYPYSAVADASGKVYVADPHNERIVWLTPEYTYGINTTENMKGQGVTWGNVYQGTNYTTRLQEVLNEKEAAASTPGFSPFMSLTGIFMAGAVLCLGRAGKKR
jgi:DNA-binding beta-propeller fold protein YncE